jgi:hypothetical protein
MYPYVGEGDSFFLSPQMFKNLVATCRCGRNKTNTHAIKCLRKTKNHYEKSDDDDEEFNEDDKKKYGDLAEKSEFIPKIPALSSGMYYSITITFQFL